MSDEVRCSCGAKHHGHICMLKSNGKTEEIAKVTSDPKYYCFICGAEANCEDNLCEPAPIKS